MIQLAQSFKYLLNAYFNIDVSINIIFKCYCHKNDR